MNRAARATGVAETLNELVRETAEPRIPADRKPKRDDPARPISETAHGAQQARGRIVIALLGLGKLPAGGGDERRQALRIDQLQHGSRL